jgi:hypothetical protein
MPSISPLMPDHSHRGTRRKAAVRGDDQSPATTPPSSVFASFGSPEITEVGAELDDKAAS